MRLAGKFCVLTCVMLSAAGGRASAEQPVTGPVSVADRGTIPGGGVQRMPAVQPNAAVSAAIADKINAALRKEDDRAIAAAADCKTSLKETKTKDPDAGWARSVDVTMAGPRFLAIVVSDSYYCGGPYPNDGLRSDFVYDLTNGRPVDWLKLFPDGVNGKAGTSAAGTPLGLVIWAELTHRGQAQASDECRDAFEESDNNGYSIGLDAKTGELVAVPVEFPHVVQACADEQRFPVAELRKLGFSAALADALDAAHTAQKP